MNPAEFVTALWGDLPPGLVQVWTLADKRTRVLRAPADAQVFEGAVDAYTAVCTVATDPGPTRRGTGANLNGLCGLWLDIDVGEKGAPSLDAAADLARAHAEPTLLVASGRGLHAWHLFNYPWRLGSTDTRGEAARAAAGWYALHAAAAAAAGWPLDQGTRDLTRVLRLPGTLNGKQDPPLPVRLLDQGPRHDRRALFALVAKGQAHWTGAPGASADVTINPAAPIGREALEALFDASPELHATFRHQGGQPHWTLSEWDMSIASQAAHAGLDDQTIANLIATHRLGWDPADTKHRRVGYLRTTIGRARARDPRQAALDELRTLAEAGRAAA